MAKKIPRIRKRNLAAIFRLRDRLDEDFELAQFVGVKPRGRHFRAWFEILRERMGVPASGAVRDALWDSVRVLAGEEFTPELLFDWYWRLAGNLPTLQGGHPVAVWSQQPFDEWVPVQITDLRWHRTRYGKFGAVFTLRVLAGLSCPLRIEKFWSSAACAFHSRMLGFSKPTGDRPYRVAEQLINLRFSALIDCERSREAPAFEKVSMTGYLLKHNRMLLSHRQRAGYKCPHDYRHACHQCPVGYLDCHAGVHRRTYVPQLCPRCKQRAWFDPGRDDQVCVSCVRKLAFKHKGD